MNTGISRVQRLNSITSRDNEGQYESDIITYIELEKNRRVLYFSDGTMELDTDSDEVDVPDQKNIEFQETFSFWSLLKNNLFRLGSSVLMSVDYVGEELASLLGITSKPELNEIELYKQNTASVNPEEGTNANWISSFNNNHHQTRGPSDLRH